jgi:flagellar hook-length control protein FliK
MRISSGLPPAPAADGAPQLSLEMGGSAEGFLILIAALLETGIEASPALPDDEPPEAAEGEEVIAAIPALLIPQPVPLAPVDPGVVRGEAAAPAPALAAQLALPAESAAPASLVTATPGADLQLDAPALAAVAPLESVETAAVAAAPMVEPAEAGEPLANPVRPQPLVAPALESQIELVAVTAPARPAAEVGGGELGSRETDGGMGEAGRPDPSAPSPLPPARPTDAPVREAAPRPQPDIDRLLRQHELRPQARVDGGDLRLEVAPEGLGPIEVRVAVRADAVHARLVADHEHARQVLETHRPSLEAALGRSQLRLEGFSVGLGQHREPASREELPPRDLRARTTPVSMPSSPPRRARGPSGQLSLHA